MYLSGKKLDALAKGKVVIPRPNKEHIELTVRALTFGEEDAAYELYPDQTPPWGFMKAPNGAPLRDDKGEVVNGPLFDDPGYKKNQEHAEQMREIVRVAMVLDSDPNLRWGTTAPAKSKQYYEDIRIELREAGLSFGDLNLILRRAAELGNVDGKALERAAEAFSERERQEDQ